VKVKTRQKRYGRAEGCVRCGRRRGIVRRYGMHLCRQCFREVAKDAGFKKYW
jgi:small subunit ribosomal protein S14